MMIYDLLDGMELVSTETSENESKKYYLFEGKGRIFYKGSRKYRDDDNNKIILMSTTDGSFDWVEEIPVENVYNVVPNIEVDEQGSIYIGMNTKVDISDFNSGSINSFGGIDILLFQNFIYWHN